MAKKKQGQSRRQQPRKRTKPASPPTRTGHDGAEDQPLFQNLRHALRSGEPLELLAIVSGFLEITDPRSRDPFAKDEERVSLAELVKTLVGTPHAETTAALTALKTLTRDELLARRIGRELANRRHPMPDWLAGLDRAVLEPDVWLLTHVLGDGDDWLLGVTLPSGDPLSAVLYVDHNLGTVVKDAFLIPEALDDLVIRFENLIDDPNQSLSRTDPAMARARLEDAIHHGSLLYPPLLSDTWPVCRPLVEWMLRMLPSGGVAPQPKEWTDEELARIAADFLASSPGTPFDHPDGRSLLDSLLWFGTSHANSDPFRWSVVTVEMLLLDWFPRKIIAEPAFLAPLPDLLRAYIRYCHDRDGIDPALTESALVAINEYEPEYQRIIRSSRAKGPEALLAGMFDRHIDESSDPVITEIVLEGLDRTVGGRFALQNLHDDPLPDEPFEWAGIPEDISPVVQEMLETCDRCADELLDVEHRTAMRRFLSRTAVGDPAIFRRKASPLRGAAAVAWVICRANATVGAHDAALSVQDLLAWFGVKGSVSQRAEPFLRANGVDPHQLDAVMQMGIPDLLTGERRADIIESRDFWLVE